MTKAICFYNNGTLDHRAFTILGLSAKDSDKAIGFFGTGFKYAIATLLRNGCEISVSAGKKGKPSTFKVYTFYLYRDKFRDKEHDFVYCHDHSTHREFELPFTAHLGANWKLWQAYRELFTNALDEGGGVAPIPPDNGSYCEGDFGDVCVTVASNELYEIYERHAKYFLNKPTLAEGQRIRCVEKIKDSDNVVYYKTMYTGTRLDKQTHFTYDYTETVELTEDRTIADTWSLRHHISHLWLEGMKYDFLIQHLPAISDEKMYENQLSADYCVPSDDFNRACAYLNKHHRSMPLWARDAYNRTRPFAEQVEHFKPNKWQKLQLKHAAKIMFHCGCPVDLSTVVTCASLPDDVIGLYKSGKIYITKEAFERGFITLLGTLYEEYVHQTKGYEDGTTRMQNHLVDKVANLMDQVYKMETEEGGA